jgi:hypothetical protein
MAAFDIHQAVAAAEPDNDDDDVFDVDALVVEAGRKPFRFRLGGDTYTMPPSPDFRAVEAISNGADANIVLGLLMGDDQWKRLQDSEAVIDVWALKQIMDRYAEHAGVTVPNSPGSTEPSTPTVPLSKRTSNGTTRSRSKTS